MILYVFVIYSCAGVKKGINHFKSSDDTLVIRTQKHKEAGLFALGAMSPVFRNPDDTVFVHAVIFPKQLLNVSRFQAPVDFRQKQPEYVDVLKATENGREIFIIDSNNNHDFTDDTFHPIEQLEWYSDENAVQHSFLIYNGKEIVKDSSWIDIGTDRGNLFYRKNEHLTASFRIGKDDYKIGIADPRNPLTFAYSERSEIALLANNRHIKDTLLLKDKVTIGQFIKLGQNHYKIEKISNNGEYLTLIRDDDFEKKTGLQLGMNAPAFKGIAVNGSEVNSADMHNKVTIIVNSCGCGGDTASAKAYYDILEKYGDAINVIRLDSKIEKGLRGMQIDVSEEPNKDFYNTYRGEYCSRMCFVIDSNNKVIDIFEGQDWKSFPVKI
ncbi:MAG: hypothetical protein DI539_05995 [Flavobacterium psychrophilum]|nr:MAG: hypothetical protein DI539_05995 [Flavobacterium psychrophilum]